MKKQIKILNRYSGEVIICGKYESIKECLEKNRSANLRSADLRSADLRSADLSYADLSYANLRSADLSYADLSSANLSSADLSSADLRSADLRSADLSSADLRSADLRSADLRSADLSSADLRSADLSYAKYKEPLFLPDLYLLKLQPSNFKLRAWKYLKNGVSPYQKSEYKINKIYQVKKYNSNENENCGSGLNVATLQWCLKDNNEADEFLEVEFFARDIIAVPYGTDGKFRVKKFKVLKKINRKQAVDLLKKKMECEK